MTTTTAELAGAYAAGVSTPESTLLRALPSPPAVTGSQQSRSATHRSATQEPQPSAAAGQLRAPRHGRMLIVTAGWGACFVAIRYGLSDPPVLGFAALRALLPGRALLTVGGSCTARLRRTRCGRRSPSSAWSTSPGLEEKE